MNKTSSSGSDISNRGEQAEMAEIWAVVDQGGEPVVWSAHPDRQQAIQQFLAASIGSPSERTWPECEASGFSCRCFHLVERETESPKRKRA